VNLDTQADFRSFLLSLRGKLIVGTRRWLIAPIGAKTPLELCRRYHRMRRRLFSHRYTDSDPFAIVWVDPDSINRSVLEWIPKHPQWGRVVGGDWDQRWEPFGQRPVYQGLCERYEEGKPWAQTALFDAFTDQLRRFGNAWGYYSIAGFEARCQEIDRLYESIRTHGYRTQVELAEEKTPRLAHVYGEINVDIGRDGTFYWRTYGQHRLAIAKILDLDHVPVVIHRRHAGWQEIRDRLQRDKTVSTSVKSHPDLQALLEP